MPEGFPTTPRAPTTVRLGAIAIALVALVVAARTTMTSVEWIGRVFPGFVLLDNRVIASVGLTHWSGATVADLYQSEVIAVDGSAVATTPEVYARVAASSPGTPFRYRLRRDGSERDVAIASQRFGARDWFLLHGMFLLNGTAFLASGLVAWLLRPRLPVARALLAGGTAVGFFLFTAMDLYGPSTFFRLHVAAESLLPGSMVQLVLLFPQTSVLARWRFLGYLLSFAILVPYQLFLYTPFIYSRILRTNMLYLGVVAIAFVVRLVLAYWRDTSELARQRVRVITLGSLIGFAVPAVVLPLAAFTGVAMNTAAVTPFVFALSLAYAVVKHDLFEIDAMVKRGAYYLALTGAVGLAYVAAVLGLNVVLRAGAATDSVAFPVLFALAVLLLFNPLRTRLQGWIDRVFFGTRYDGAELLASIGAALAGVLRRDEIARVVDAGVQEAMPNAGTRLFAAAATDGRLRGGGELRDACGDGAIPAVLVHALANGRLRTAFDPPEVYRDAEEFEAVQSALGELGAMVAVPVQLEGEVVGALTAGPKRSGFFYTAGDAAF